MDPAYLTPMVRVIKPLHPPQDYFTLEPAMLADDSACIPYRWFIRNGKYHALAHKLELLVTEGVSGWVVREDQQTTVTEDTLKRSLPLFVDYAAQNGLPSPHSILGKVLILFHDGQSLILCLRNGPC